MGEIPTRGDTWIQWALLLLTILSAMWYGGSQLGAINQELYDIRAWQQLQTQRVDALEKEVRDLTVHALSK